MPSFAAYSVHIVGMVALFPRFLIHRWGRSRAIISPEKKGVHSQIPQRDAMVSFGDIHHFVSKCLN